jgi:hypothetical protein
VHAAKGLACGLEIDQELRLKTCASVSIIMMPEYGLDSAETTKRAKAMKDFHYRPSSEPAFLVSLAQNHVLLAWTLRSFRGSRESNVQACFAFDFPIPYLYRLDAKTFAERISMAGLSMTQPVMPTTWRVT